MLRKLQDHWDKLFLLLFIIIYTVVFSWLSIARHNAFASGFDLGNMDQTIWNTLHGRFFSLTGDTGTISRFSIHADLLLVFLSPLYLLWNNVRILLIAQSFFIAIGIIPAYLLSQKLIKNKFISLILVLIYLLNPWMQWVNMYDFHAVALAIPLFLFSFYFAYTKKWKWFFAVLFLAILGKENESLVIAFFGLFIFFIFKERKIGFITFLLGIIWFFTAVFIVMPHYIPSGKVTPLSMYQFTDKDGSQILFPSFQILIQKFILDKDSLGYYINLLKPFAFLPLLGFPYIVLVLPKLSINMLSSQALLRSLTLHYTSGMIPWLVIAMIYSIFYLKTICKQLAFTSKYSMLFTYVIVLGAFLIAMRVNYHYSPLPTTPSCWCYSYNVTNEDREFEKLLQTIPQSASITASPEIRPHVTHRENSFTLPVAIDSADFIALIDQNRIVGNYEPKEFELILRDQIKISKQYFLVKHIGHFYLYKKNS